MAIYKSKPVTVAHPADDMFGRLTDLTRLQGALDKLPALLEHLTALRMCVNKF